LRLPEVDANGNEKRGKDPKLSIQRQMAKTMLIFVGSYSSLRALPSKMFYASFMNQTRSSIFHYLKIN